MTLVTWNPNDKGSNIQLSNSDLVVSKVSDINQWYGCRATHAKTTGKWYWELKFNNTESWNAGRIKIGVAGSLASLNVNSTSGNPSTPESATWQDAEFITYVKDDILGFGLDISNKKIIFYKNGIYINEKSFDGVITTSEIFPYIIQFTSSSSPMITEVNFGATRFIYNIPEGYEPYDINNSVWYTGTLIKNNNIIYTYNNNIWEDTLLSEPITKEEFFQHSFAGLNTIPKDKWVEFTGNIEILCMSHNEGELILELITPSFKPIDKLDEELEIITWTDENPEIIPGQLEAVQDDTWSEEGKLFETVIDEGIKIDAVTGISIE